MHLSDIENPSSLDSARKITVKTARGSAAVIGYTPAVPGIGAAHWHVLLEGDKPGNERQVLDAEILEEPPIPNPS